VARPFRQLGARICLRGGLLDERQDRLRLMVGHDGTIRI
jgi:hypothetical protein